MVDAAEALDPAVQFLLLGQDRRARARLARDLAGVLTFVGAARGVRQKGGTDGVHAARQRQGVGALAGSTAEEQAEVVDERPGRLVW